MLDSVILVVCSLLLHLHTVSIHISLLCIRFSSSYVTAQHEEEMLVTNILSFSDGLALFLPQIWEDAIVARLPMLMTLPMQLQRHMMMVSKWYGSQGGREEKRGEQEKCDGLQSSAGSGKSTKVDASISTTSFLCALVCFSLFPSCFVASPHFVVLLSSPPFLTETHTILKSSYMAM